MGEPLICFRWRAALSAFPWNGTNWQEKRASGFGANEQDTTRSLTFKMSGQRAHDVWSYVAGMFETSQATRISSPALHSGLQVACKGKSSTF